MGRASWIFITSITILAGCDDAAFEAGLDGAPPQVRDAVPPPRDARIDLDAMSDRDAMVDLDAAPLDAADAERACEGDEDCGPGAVCVRGQCMAREPECRADRDCRGDQVCVDGACEARPPACRLNSDCAAGEICEDGACVDDPLACRLDADCAAEEICQDGACVPAPPECRADRDCAAGEICQAGDCVPAPPECRLDADCAAGEICRDGACVPAPPECRADRDCAAGEICRDGACVAQVPDCRINSDCAAGEICQAGDCVPAPPECRINSDCAAGEICQNGDCVPAPPECRLDADCAPGEICQAGDCVPAPPECGLDADCAPGEICQAGDCVPAPPVCRINSDCAPGEICQNGDCVPAPPECRLDADCAPGEICQNGDCVPAPPECRLDADCAPGEICQNGDCVPAPPECRLDADCAPGEICQNGDCVPAPPECRINSDCAPGEICQAGDCVPAPPECRLDADCAPGEICQAGDCVPAPPECRLDADCAPGEICQNGDCVPAPPECRADADCAPGEICQNGDCVPAPPECRVDADCAPGEICQGGDCVPAPGPDAPACAADALEIVRAFGEDRGSTANAPSTEGASCGGGASGREVVYAFSLDGAAELCLSTVGSDFDTVLHVRTDCDDAGSEVACNDDDVGLQSRLTFQAAANTTYFVFVDAFGANTGGDYAFTITPGPCVDDPPPPECRVDADCAAGEICQNGDCVPAPPECRVDADCAPGEICQGGDCVPAPGPDAPACAADALEIVRAFGEDRGSTANAPSTEGASCGGGASGREVVYAFRFGGAAEVCLSTVGSAFDTVLHVRSDCDDAGSEVACNDDDVGLQSRLTFQAAANTTYYAFVDAFGANTGGDYVFTITPGPCVDDPPPPECRVDADCAAGEICQNGDCVPAPPECRVDADCAPGEICQGGDCVPAPGPDAPACAADALEIVRAFGEDRGSTANAPSTEGASCGGGASGREVAYAFRFGGAAEVCLSTVGSAFDTVLHVRSDCDDAGSEVACNDDDVGLQSRLTFQAAANTTYYAFVDAFGANTGGDYVFTITPGPCVDDPPPPDDGAVDGFDYPVGAPIREGGDGFVSAPNDGDGYYNAQDFTAFLANVGHHCGEDWNGEGGGETDFGDPVYATANGVVVFAGAGGRGWGDIILVQHDVPGAAVPAYEIIQSQYAHLSRMLVEVGDVVIRGQQIGEIGNADGAWVAHLHFELRWDESQPPGGTGYDCPDDATGMTDPSDFIDAHRQWP